MNITKILFIVLAFASCKPSINTRDAYLDNGKQISFAFAEGLKMCEFKDHYYLKIQTPNDSNKVFGEYILYKDKKPEIPFAVDAFIKIPVKKVAPLSTTHIGFIAKLHQEASVAGVTDPFRIFNSTIQTALKKKEIKYLGKSLSTDIEKVIALSPELVIESGFPNASNKNQTLQQAGIPILYTVDWMEGTALARAEWLKLFGYLYNEPLTADSIFADISAEYQRLKTTVAFPPTKPQVFAGNSFKGVWYLPGGNSYVSKLIQDAGGTYIMQGDTSVASLPVNFEVVYNKIADADIWLNVEENSIAELIIKDERVQNFPPVVSSQVYNRNLNSNAQGANAYFEDGICNPHKILSDLITIFHPNLMKDDQPLYYYRRLKDE